MKLVPYVSAMSLICATPATSQDVTDDLINNLANELAEIYTHTGDENFDQSGLNPWRHVGQLEVTDDGVFLHAGASSGADIIQPVDSGDTYKVIDRVDDWYAVSGNGVNGWLNASAVVVTRTPPIAEGFPSMPELRISAKNQIANLLQKAIDMKEDYRGHPYIGVEGFSVQISITGPALEMQFGFK